MKPPPEKARSYENSVIEKVDARGRQGNPSRIEQQDSAEHNDSAREKNRFDGPLSPKLHWVVSIILRRSRSVWRVAEEVRRSSVVPAIVPTSFQLNVQPFVPCF